MTLIVNTSTGTDTAYWDDFAEHLFDPDTIPLEDAIRVGALVAVIGSDAPMQHCLTLHSLKDSATCGTMSDCDYPARTGLHDDETAFWAAFVRDGSECTPDVCNPRTVPIAVPRVEDGDVRQSTATGVPVPTLRSILSSSAASVRSGASSKRTPRSVTFSDLPQVHYEDEGEGLSDGWRSHPSLSDTCSRDDSSSDNSDGDGGDSARGHDEPKGSDGTRTRPSAGRRLTFLQRLLSWIRKTRASAYPQETASWAEKGLLSPRPSLGRPVISGPLPLTSSLSRRASSSSSSRRSASTAPAAPAPRRSRDERAVHRPRKLWQIWPSLSCTVP